MAGRLFAIVGPSGAGKDTLMQAAKAARPDLHLVRRVITRPSEAGGEDFEGVTEAEFARRKASGAFVLDWQAHGLSYGIPISVERAIAEGRNVLFNGSRAMLGDAWQAFPGLSVVHVTAPVPVLADRLAARGRESRADIAQRLARVTYEIPYGLPVRTVENGGALDQAVADFLAALAPVRV